MKVIYHYVSLINNEQNLCGIWIKMSDFESAESGSSNYLPLSYIVLLLNINSKTVWDICAFKIVTHRTVEEKLLEGKPTRPSRPALSESARAACSLPEASRIDSLSQALKIK